MREEEDVGYRTLLVHLEQGHSNANLLQIASDLSEYFDAGVIGIAASPPCWTPMRIARCRMPS